MLYPPPLKIDASNRNAHYFLNDQDECYFFHEYTSHQGYNYSVGNQLVYNLKKSVLLRGQPQYKYKQQAIVEAAATMRSAFERSAWVFNGATFAAIPPSKAIDHPEYDDRISQIVQAACAGRETDARDLIYQSTSYDSSHTRASGHRLRPHELEAIYVLDPIPPRGTVILIDDVLTNGAHFVAARNTIHRVYPQTRVIGFFVARRVFSASAGDFPAL